MSTNQRQFRRIPFRAKAEMNANGIIYSTAEISNLGLGGCLLHVLSQFAADTPCTVKFVMTGASSELSIRMRGRVVRNCPNAIAVQFTEIDNDSLFLLQNLIRNNTADPKPDRSTELINEGFAEARKDPSDDQLDKPALVSDIK